ncbi:MAG TPA: ATP-binding protein [Ktedonobacteraceae bacterium]|nr:ATP-binding protein [Ktedonobacteraceae bacterium]
MEKERSSLLEKEGTQELSVEQFCQLLECDGACLLFHCSDDQLYHPLLDIWSASLPDISAGVLTTIEKTAVECEPVEALCDMAIQSGRLLTLPPGSPALHKQGIRSVAAFPLERPAGLLGTLLLVDSRPRWFSKGEERLLHAYLPIYIAQLEENWLRQTRSIIKAYNEQISRNQRERDIPDQIIKHGFVAMVGHELRAPLSIIRGYTGLLQIYGATSDQPDLEMTPERQQRYLDEIMEQTHLLELLINDLLDISQLQRGKLSLHIDAIEIGTLCQQVVQLGQIRANQLAQNKHFLRCRIDDQLPPVLADSNRLRQVLLNLLENATKYSPAGGYIDLEVSLVQGHTDFIRLAIKDSGIGIPPLQSKRLFQPFERLERADITHIPGSGLGLYIANKLIEAMAGKIEVQSNQNQGTTVCVTLPVLQNL